MPIIIVGFERAAWRINNPTYGSDITGLGTAYANSIYSSPDYVPAKAIDNNDGQWLTANVAFPHVWWLDFGAGVTKKVRKLRIYHQSPYLKTFKLQGSNDGSSYVDLLSTVVENVTGWHEWTFANSTGYRYYRLYFSDCYHETNLYTAICEIEMMEVTE